MLKSDICIVRTHIKIRSAQSEQSQISEKHTEEDNSVSEELFHIGSILFHSSLRVSSLKDDEWVFYSNVKVSFSQIFILIT